MILGIYFIATDASHSGIGVIVGSIGVIGGAIVLILGARAGGSSGGRNRLIRANRMTACGRKLPLIFVDFT